MNTDTLYRWADELASEVALLSADEARPLLVHWGQKLLRQAVYEPVGDRGSVYRRIPAKERGDEIENQIERNV